MPGVRRHDRHSAERFSRQCGDSFSACHVDRGCPGRRGSRARVARPLSNHDSAALFGRAAGRTPTENETVVLARCGGLPLALRMAGARLRHRPGWTVAVLAERLRDNAGRFDEVFGMSLQQLDPVQRRVLDHDVRLLDAAAAAAGRLGRVGQRSRCWRTWVSPLHPERPYEEGRPLDRIIELARELDRPHDEKLARVARDLMR